MTMNGDKIEFPALRFEALTDHSEEALRRFIWDGQNAMASGFLVCLRAKYRSEKEWEYMVEFCTRYEWDGIMWNMDWYEGQQDVEYLGICVVPDWRPTEG